MKSTQPRRAPLRVTWTLSEKQAVILAIMGFQIKAIAAKTSLTTGQIYYRLKRLNLRDMRHDFATMRSPIAHRFINTNTKFSQHFVFEQIRDLHKKLYNKRRAA